MPIEIGQRLPEATFREMGPEGPRNVTTREVFDERKIVLFAVPGAFTPTCHRNHFPGFLANYDTILAKGVDEVAVVAVNDVFVLAAWAEATGGKGKIRFLSDGSAAFTKALGLDADMSAGHMGTRSRRYAMIVDDGVVKVLNVEDQPGQAAISSAENILAAL